MSSTVPQLTEATVKVRFDADQTEELVLAPETDIHTGDTVMVLVFGPAAPTTGYTTMAHMLRGLVAPYGDDDGGDDVSPVEPAPTMPYTASSRTDGRFTGRTREQAIANAERIANDYDDGGEPA